MPTDTADPTRRRRSGFWATSAIFALFLASSAAPTPLYPRYAASWHLSAGALTVAFGVYAIALLITLLILGGLSDAVGRRPVVVTALTLLAASLVVFVLADDYVWLLLARALAGVAAGLITPTASAAMLDLEPAGRPGSAPLINVLGAMGGQAAGMLASAILVQYATRPTTLIYEVLILGTVVLAAAYLWRAEETVTQRSRYVIRIELGIPRSAMAAFLATLPCLIASWALSSLYASLGPDIVTALVHSDNALVSVTAPAGLLTAGAISATVLRRRAPLTRMLIGSGLLALGSALTAVALGVHDVPLFYVSIAIAGLGFGVSFSGAVQTLLALAPPAARAALVATVYVVAYVSFSVPAVIAGFVSVPLGLLTTSTIFSAVVAGLSLISLLATRASTRPGPTRHHGRVEAHHPATQESS